MQSTNRVHTLLEEQSDDIHPVILDRLYKRGVPVVVYHYEESGTTR